MGRNVRTLLNVTGLLAALALLALTSSINYLLFHSLVEGFSIVIAFGIFFVAFNSRSFVENNYLLFLGIAYFFIGILDFFHTLAYEGMGVFPGYGANLPTQLWIQARYLEAGTLLLAPLFFHRRIRVWIIYGCYALITTLFLVTIFIVPVFPDCFVEPGGLTPFKTVSEYIISFLLIVALVLVIRRRELISKSMRFYLSASILATMGSELMFTFYISVYGLSNMLGHLLKILSFYCIYKGVIVACLRNPYSSLFLELNRSEAELRKKEKELSARNRDLEAFIHTAGHDLRTPLMSIAGYAQLLEQSWQRRDAAKLQEMTRHIREGVNRLNDLLTDLLNFAFIGRQAVVPVPIDISSLIDRISEEKRGQISATGTRIIRSEDLPTLFMPETEAYQLFSNLISNSLKFIRPGVSPAIEIGVENHGAQGFGTVTVSDNGLGIDKKNLEKIFDLFVTLEGERRDGTGAGLAIVKRIVEHNGGSIHVTSVPGVGTTFTLVLPVVMQKRPGKEETAVSR
ncbi:MAG: MASE3 domain-containing protein [Pseudomonadota bacterium]|jgi:signal transduction histidine kinase